MRRGAHLALGAALGAVLALHGPLAAAPVRAQTTLNVQGADIRAFIDSVARSSGRTFIVDPEVTGTVTVSSQRSLGRTELFEVFLSTLRANGLVVAPTASGAWRISPAAGAAQRPDTRGSERFSTEVFRLTSIDAASAAETVRPLVGPQGQVLATTGNSLVVADFVDNLARVRALLARLDVDRSSLDVVTLENASAREIAAVLDRVLAPPGGGGQGLVTVTAVESSNSLVLRGEPVATARIRALISDLDGRALSSDDVRVVFLEHAAAEQLLPVLQQVVGQTVSPPTSEPARIGREDNATPSPPADTAAASPGQKARIARFPGANALVISASPEMQRRLAEVIRQLDVRRQQVLIEAIVVELSDAAVRELGVQWLLAKDGRTLLASTSNQGAPIIPLAGGALAETLDEDDPRRKTLQDAAIKALLSANGFVGGTLQDIGDSGLLGFVVNAARADSGSNLLQTPSLMTLDNEEATILVGQEVPVTTGETLLEGNANPFRTTQRQDIGVKLVVRPQINAGGSITLSLRQEVSSINGILSNGARDLVLNKRELETTLVVDDGAIAVAGGLLEQNEQLSADRVPGLGDLPWVGGLFRSTGRQRGRTNLMVFIRPTVVRSADEAAALGADRWGYMRDRQREADPDVEPSLDAMLRDYMRSLPATPVAGTATVAEVSVDARPDGPTQ